MLSSSKPYLNELEVNLIREKIFVGSEGKRGGRMDEYPIKESIEKINLLLNQLSTQARKYLKFPPYSSARRKFKPNDPDPRVLFNQNLTKIRKMLFFCVSEISEIFCLDVFTKVFKVYELLFDCSTAYTKFHESEVEYLNKKQEEVIKYENLIELGREYEKVLEQQKIDEEKFEELKREKGLENMDLKDVQSMFGKTGEVRSQFNQLNMKIEMARRQAFLNNFVVSSSIDDMSEYLPEKDVNEFEFRKKINFRKKVQNTVNAVSDVTGSKESLEIIKTMFEPKIIIETTRRVFKNIIDEKSKSVDDLTKLIARISKYKKTNKSNSIRELELLAYEMQEVLSKQNDKMTSYINSDLLKKEYLSKFLKSAKGDLINRIAENNKEIAFKSIDIYKQSKIENSRAIGTQTYLQNSFLGQLFPSNPYDPSIDFREGSSIVVEGSTQTENNYIMDGAEEHFKEIFVLDPFNLAEGRKKKRRLSNVPKLNLKNRKHLQYFTEKLEYFPGTPLKVLIKQPVILQKKIKLLENSVRMKLNQIRKNSIEFKRQMDLKNLTVENLEKANSKNISNISQLETENTNKETRIHFLRKEITDLQTRIDDNPGDMKYKRMRGVLYAIVDYFLKVVRDLEKCNSLEVKTLSKEKTDGKNSGRSEISRVVDIDYKKAENDKDFLLINKGSLYNLRRCLKRIKLHANDAIFDRYELMNDDLVRILNSYKNLFLFDLKHFETHKVRHRDIFLPMELNSRTLNDCVYFFLSKRIGMLLFSGMISKRLLKLLQKKFQEIKNQQTALKHIRRKNSSQHEEQRPFKGKPTVPKLSEIKKQEKQDEEELLDIFNETLNNIEKDYSVSRSGSVRDLDTSIARLSRTSGKHAMGPKGSRRRASMRKSIYKTKGYSSSFGNILSGLNNNVMGSLINGNSRSIDKNSLTPSARGSLRINNRSRERSNKRMSMFTMANAKKVSKKLKSEFAKNSVLVPVEESEIPGDEVANIVSLKKAARKIKKRALYKVSSLKAKEGMSNEEPKKKSNNKLKSKSKGKKKGKGRRKRGNRSKKKGSKSKKVKKGSKKSLKKSAILEEVNQSERYSEDNELRELNDDIMDSMKKESPAKQSLGSDDLTLKEKSKFNKVDTIERDFDEEYGEREEEVDYIEEMERSKSSEGSFLNKKIQLDLPSRQINVLKRSSSQKPSINQRKRKKNSRSPTTNRKAMKKKKKINRSRTTKKNPNKLIKTTIEISKLKNEELIDPGSEFLSGEKLIDNNEYPEDEELSYYSIDDTLNVIKRVESKLKIYRGSNQGKFTFIKDKNGLLVKIKNRFILEDETRQNLLRSFSGSNASAAKSEISFTKNQLIEEDDEEYAEDLDQYGQRRDGRKRRVQVPYDFYEKKKEKVVHSVVQERRGDEDLSTRVTKPTPKNNLVHEKRSGKKISYKKPNWSSREKLIEEPSNVASNDYEEKMMTYVDIEDSAEERIRRQGVGHHLQKVYKRPNKQDVKEKHQFFENRSTENNTYIKNNSSEMPVNQNPKQKFSKVSQESAISTFAMEDLIESIMKKLDFPDLAKHKIHLLMHFLLFGFNNMGLTPQAKSGTNSFAGMNQRAVLKSRNDMAKNQFDKILNFFSLSFEDARKITPAMFKNTLVRGIKRDDMNVDILLSSLLLGSQVFEERDQETRLGSVSSKERPQNPGYYVIKKFSQRKNSKLGRHKSQSFATTKGNNSSVLPSVNQFQQVKSRNPISIINNNQDLRRRSHFRNLSSGNLTNFNNDFEKKREIYMDRRKKIARLMMDRGGKKDRRVQVIVERKDFNPLKPENLDNPLYLVQRIVAEITPAEEEILPPNIVGAYKDKAKGKNIKYDLEKKREKFRTVVKKELGRYLKLHKVDLKDKKLQKEFFQKKENSEFLMSIDPLDSVDTDMHLNGMTCEESKKNGVPCKHLSRFYSRLMWIYEQMIKNKGEPLEMKTISFGDVIQDIDKQREKGIFEGRKKRRM